tara:strand:+ start:2591 stop:2866 length:276 start_codon:yes stop_codon:yes gene_type:complete
MGGGGAAIAAMMQALRSNRIILKNRRKIFDKNPSKENLSHKKVHFKEPTPEELAQFRARLKSKQKGERRIIFLVWTGALIALCTGIYFLLR